VLVNFYSKPTMQASIKVRRILDKFAAEYGLQINEIRLDGSGPKVQAPALEIEGSRLRVLDSARGSLDEATIQAYLELAKATGHAPQASPSAEGAGERTRRAADAAGVPTRHRAKSFMWEHRVGAMVGALSAFMGVACLAPLLPSAGLGNVYSVVFSAFRLVCVQTPDRSPVIAGHQGCLCWRCIAIYAGSLLFGILYTLGRDGKLPQVQWLTKAVGLRGLILFSLPMLIDGLSHTFGLRPGDAFAHSPDFWLGWGEWQFDWWLRVITAGIATVGAVKFLCPRLDKIAGVYALASRPAG
jgi:uncharacterized membrane protein